MPRTFVTFIQLSKNKPMNWSTCCSLEYRVLVCEESNNISVSDPKLKISVSCQSRENFASSQSPSRLRLY